MSQSSLTSLITQKVLTSTVNSSTTNLAVGNSYTFTGTIDISDSFTGVQLSLFADQNCTVRVEQSQNTTPNWDIIDSFQYYANQSFGITVQLVASYFRIVITSDGNKTTTVFRLKSVLVPVVSSLPRAVDIRGNLRVAIQSSEDNYGWESENTPTGEIRVSEVCRLTGAPFELAGNAGVPDPNYWTVVVAANGTAAQANGQVIIDTAITSPNGSSILTSVRRAPYGAGSANRYRSVLMLNNNGAANNLRKWGAVYGSGFPATPTVTDGAWFQLNGTQFSVNTQLANGVVASVTSFNGRLGSAYLPDFTIPREYEIYWSNNSVVFTVDGQILHAVTADGEPIMGTKSLFIYHASINSSGLQTSNTIKLRAASIARLGKETSFPQRGLVTTAGTYNFKYGPGMLHKIIFGTVAAGTLLTIYDDTSGTANTILTIGAFSGNNDGASSVICNIPFSNGLKVVSTGTWSAAFVYE